MVKVVKVKENEIFKIESIEKDGVLYTPFERLVQYCIVKYLEIPLKDVYLNLADYETEGVGSYHIKDYMEDGIYTKDLPEQIILWYMFDKTITKNVTEEELKRYTYNGTKFIFKFEELVGGLVNEVTGRVSTTVQADFSNLPVFIERRKEIFDLAVDDPVKNSDLIETKIAELEDIAKKYLRDRPTHPLSVAIKSGVYNELQAIKSFVIIGKQSLEGSIQPFPVVNGYFNGFRTPIEIINEVSSAKTANKYSLLFVAFTELFSKEMQFNIPNEPIIEEDCGTTNGVTQEIKYNTLGSAVWIDSEWVETHRYNINKYIGKTLKVRMPHTCGYLEKGKICKKCIGIITKHHPKATNILFTLVAMLNERVSQTVLKTKHFIASAENSNFGRFINPEHFKWEHNDLIALKDIKIYVNAFEVSKLLFGEDGPVMKSFDDSMIKDTKLSHISSYLTERVKYHTKDLSDGTKKGDPYIVLDEHHVIGNDKMSFHEDWIRGYLEKEYYDVVNYNNVKDELFDEVNKYFGDVNIPIEINILAGEKVFRFPEKTNDIKKISDEIIAAFTLPKERTKLQDLGMFDWVDTINGVCYLRQEHFDDFYHKVRALFENVGGIPDVVLSTCITLLMVDKDGVSRGNFYMKGYKRVLVTGYMSSAARSASSDVFSDSRYKSNLVTGEPMDSILNS